MRSGIGISIGAPARPRSRHALRVAWLIGSVLWIAIVVWAMKPYLPAYAGQASAATAAFGQLLAGRNLAGLCSIVAALAIVPPLVVLFGARAVSRMAR